jgi:hypothetical protein
MIKRRIARLRALIRKFRRDEDGAWFLWLLIGLALNIIGYLLMPRPKTAKPEAAQDMDNPTADAGRPLPVVFGTLTVKGLNVLDFRDKNKRTIKVRA